MYIQLAKGGYGSAYISTMDNNNQTITCKETYIETFEEYLKDFKSMPEKYLVLELNEATINIFEK